MALQKNMTLSGGATINNCYVRIHSVEAVKANEDSDWTLKVVTNVYKDADIRNATVSGQGPHASNIAGSGAVHLFTPPEYKFDYNPGLDHGDLIAVAYERLKSHEDFSDASDV